MKYLDIDALDMELGELKSNIEKIETEYGSEFICESKTLNVKIPVKLLQEDVVSIGIKYYTLIHDIPLRQFDMFPLKINFIDPETKKLGSNVYIQNIHATSELTGTLIVKFALKLLKGLGCTKAYLHDGTEVQCKSNGLGYDLTYYKLLEKNKTFYTNLGFDHDISVTSSYGTSFKSKSKLKKFINKIIKSCRKIKISTLVNYYQKLLDICNQIIKNSVLINNLIVRCTYTYNIIEPVETKNIWICKTNILDLVQECAQMLHMLQINNTDSGTKEKYLSDLLVSLFKLDRSCWLLESFEKYVMNSKIYEIEYNNIILSRKYLDCFKVLKHFRYNSNYSYQFV